MSQTKEKRDSLVFVDLTFEWYEDDMAFRVFIVIIFRTNGKKTHLYANDFRNCYGNFFRKWHSESYLITAMFKVKSLLSNYEAHRQLHFERYPTVLHFTDMD